jgi:hypothetical protein
MTQIERFRYYGACQSPRPLGASFGGHDYGDNDNGDDPDENAADLTDDELEDERPSS